jgi:ABC-type transporter Mla subunit MlaD
VRRLLAAAIVGALALVAGVLFSPAQGADTYNVDVLMDDAFGLIPGQNVQIAGAKVGTLKEVVLTKRGDLYRARIKMSVEGEFAPFKEDAACTIRPQGLIAENYVNCDPGSPDSKPLEGKDGNPPTVPEDRVSKPVPVQELFDIWTAPVRDRLGLVLNTVGIGTAGLGADFNKILRNANPALEQANRVIALLRRQKADLATILDRSDEIVGKLADNGQTFRQFIDEADETTAITAARQRQLGDSVRLLPPLIDELEPAMRDLNSVVKDGLPLVKQLRVAAPDLNRLYADIGPFADEVRPTLAKLRPILVSGAKTLNKAAPLTRILRSYAHNSLGSVKTAAPVFTNLRDAGFIENLLSTFYRAAAWGARFDERSHLLPAYLVANTCSIPTTVTVLGCSARYTDTPTGVRTAAKTKRAAKKTPKQGAPAPLPAPKTQQGQANQKPDVQLLPSDPIAAVKGVLDAVLKPVLDPLKDPLKKLLPRKQRGESAADAGLLRYLLG